MIGAKVHPPAEIKDLTRWPGWSPGAPICARHVGMLGALWAFCSLLLLSFRPGYGFPPFELLDSWIYTSYQWAPRAQINDFGATYYGSRLSWILPGAFLHHFLPPVTAELVFKLGFSALLAGAVSLVVHTGHGLRWALLSIAAVVCCPLVIRALHADYTDTPVFTYAAVTIACITLAKDSARWPLWIAGAGGSLALMAVANLGSLSTVGVALGAYHLLWLRWPFSRQLAAIGCYAVSAAAVLGSLGGMHVFLGGHFYFLKPQVDMIFYFKKLASNPWAPTEPLWFLSAPWLILPFATLLWGAFCSFSPQPENPRGTALIRALTIALTVSLGLAITWEMRRTVTVLSLYYYATFHLAVALPLLVLCCAHTWRGLTRIGPLAPLLVGLLLVALSIKPPGQWASLSFQSTGMLRHDWLEVGCAITLVFAGAIGLVVTRRRPAGGRAIAAFLLLALMLLSVPVDYHAPPISDRLRERYLAVRTAYFNVEKRQKHGSFRYWVDAQNPNGISLASTKLWGYRLLTLKNFPELDKAQFVGGPVIVPLRSGDYPRALKQLGPTLEQWGLEMSEPGLEPTAGPAGTGFDLFSFQLQPRAIDPEQPQSPDLGSIRMLAGFEYYSEHPYVNSLNFSRQDATAIGPIDTARGFPVFMRTDPGDFAATHFRQLSPVPNGKSRCLLLVAVMPADGHCVVGLQDNLYRNLREFTLTQTGRTVHSVQVPADSTGYRVYFSSPRNAATPMPVNVNVYDLLQ